MLYDAASTVFMALATGVLRVHAEAGGEEPPHLHGGAVNPKP